MILNVNIINFAFPPIINVKMNFINIKLAHNMNGFTIISKLGDGAYSVVYKVKRVADGKIYALKKVKLTNLSSKEKQNALNEVRILASVKSTFVISYKEAFIDDKDQSLCIVMEYADKGDLYQKITQFKKMNTQFEEIDVSITIKQIIKDTALQLKEKNMKFVDKTPDKIIIHGATGVVYSIFRNLTDNAIAYAGEGSTITLEAHQSGEYRWSFTFSDNGVGVDDKHLPRLFERFYRVDKGRSRKLGGTGLGLAIVKNGVLLHGGTINAENAPGGGLKFEFSLAK